MRKFGRARYLAEVARYLAHRFLAGFGTLLAVTVLVFAGLHLVPGSYTQLALGPFATAEERAHVNAEYGLDRPVPLQYGIWLEHIASGDFGTSLGTGIPVSEVLVRRLPVTVELALLSLLLAMLVGLPLALLAGMARGRASRSGSRLGGAVAMSTPDFVIGSLFVYLFSRYALGLRVSGYVPLTEDVVENLRSMLLPAITLSVFGVALIVRTGRDAVAGVLSEPYVTAALARGERRAHIVRHHVIRNASPPVITVIAIYTGYLMGGAVIVENLFSLPGLGQAALLGINERDYPVVQGVVLVASAAFIATSLLADLSYGVIDPRVRRAGRT